MDHYSNKENEENMLVILQSKVWNRMPAGTHSPKNRLMIQTKKHLIQSREIAVADSQEDFADNRL